MVPSALVKIPFFIIFSPFAPILAVPLLPSSMAPGILVRRPHYIAWGSSSRCHWSPPWHQTDEPLWWKADVTCHKPPRRWRRYSANDSCSRWCILTGSRCYLAPIAEEGKCRLCCQRFKEYSQYRPARAVSIPVTDYPIRTGVGPWKFDAKKGPSVGWLFFFEKKMFEKNNFEKHFWFWFSFFLGGGSRVKFWIMIFYPAKTKRIRLPRIDMKVELGGGNRPNNFGKKLMKNNSMIDDRISRFLTRGLVTPLGSCGFLSATSLGFRKFYM